MKGVTVRSDTQPDAYVYSGRTMSTTSHLEKLNGPQRKAVTFGEPLPDNKGFKSGPLLIIAGAGVLFAAGTAIFERRDLRLKSD